MSAEGKDADNREDGRKVSNAAAAATGASWNIGDHVVLKAQMSKGQNELGGVARVLSVFDDGTYLVKLSLGE